MSLPSRLRLAVFYLLIFFYKATAPTEIYTLSLHDALPISSSWRTCGEAFTTSWLRTGTGSSMRSEEHTSELQSHSDLVCRLLLEKKKTMISDARHRLPQELALSVIS